MPIGAARIAYDTAEGVPYPLLDPKGDMVQAGLGIVVGKATTPHAVLGVTKVTASPQRIGLATGGGYCCSLLLPGGGLLCCIHFFSFLRDGNAKRHCDEDAKRHCSGNAKRHCDEGAKRH